MKLRGRSEGIFAAHPPTAGKKVGSLEGLLPDKRQLVSAENLPARLLPPVGGGRGAAGWSSSYGSRQKKGQEALAWCGCLWSGAAGLHGEYVNKLA